MKTEIIIWYDPFVDGYPKKAEINEPESVVVMIRVTDLYKNKRVIFGNVVFDEDGFSFWDIDPPLRKWHDIEWSYGFENYDDPVKG